MSDKACVLRTRPGIAILGLLDDLLLVGIENLREHGKDEEKDIADRYDRLRRALLDTNKVLDALIKRRLREV